MAATEPPEITDWLDFEVFFEEERQDEHGNWIFTATKYILIDDSSNVFFGELPIRKLSITLEQARECLCRVPDHEIYPPTSQDLSTYVPAEQESESIFIKRPKIHSYSEYRGSTTLADQFLATAKDHHFIQQHPHPNIVQFKGCIVKRDMIIGLALEKCPHLLRARHEDEDEDAQTASPAQKQTWLQDLRAAARHLHSLGIAHNDINPNNIMLDQELNVRLVDLGSCMTIGTNLVEGGTPGWNEEFTRVSSVGNDEYGLRKLEEWMDAERIKVVAVVDDRRSDGSRSDEGDDDDEEGSGGEEGDEVPRGDDEDDEAGPESS